ncbi:hypothetical protein PBCVOR070422_219R [Paramecium bursaria Chlorella virus OR0704.2.2]|nr:hypothetical protein PBCVOR070422_219R [Paramecium bursaria Chlorella virus OR0704.2.2]
MKTVSFSKTVKIRYIDPEGSAKQVVKYKSDNFSYANVQAEIFNRRKNAIERGKENMATLRHNIKIYNQVLKDLPRNHPDFEHFMGLKEDAWSNLKLWSYKLQHYR